MAIGKNLANKIVALWSDPTFSGSFTGASTFREALAREKKIHIGYGELLQLLGRIPKYVETLRPRRHFKRRPIHVHGYGVLFQADLAEMPPLKKAGHNYKYFLLCIDAFSRKIWAEPLETKRASVVAAAFERIFTQANVVPERLETDQGGEFTGSKKFFQEKHIYWRVKYGIHKAALAERGIGIIKRRLYRLLRTKVTNDWVEYLPGIVRHYNATPKYSIGNVRPVDITSPEDDPKIDAALKREGRLYKPPSREQMLANQRAYEKDEKKLQVGQYVYVDFKEHPFFSKAYDLKRKQIYKIYQIRNLVNPPLYYVEDLQGVKEPASFYAEQLRPTRKPEDTDLWDVEKVLSSRKRKDGKTELLIRWLGYPAKFDSWIPEEQLHKPVPPKHGAANRV